MESARPGRLSSVLLACLPVMVAAVPLAIWVLPVSPGAAPFIAGWAALGFGIGMLRMRIRWVPVAFMLLLAPLPLVMTVGISYSAVRVSGNSMLPTLQPDEVLLMDRRASPGTPLGLYVLEGDTDAPIVKRLVGMPGQTLEIREGRLYADGVEVHGNDERPIGTGQRLASPLTLGDDEYFFIGDNPSESRDSRTFGPVPGEKVLGRVLLRLKGPRGFGTVG